MAESAKLFIYLNDMCICAPISIYHCLSINNIYICNKSIHWCDLLIFLNHPKQSARRSNNFHQAAHTERYYLPPPQPPHIFVEELKARSFWRSRKPQTYSTNYMPIYHFSSNTYLPHMPGLKHSVCCVCFGFYGPPSHIRKTCNVTLSPC